MSDSSPTAVAPVRLDDIAALHPHLHKYSDHVIIHQGWVYEAKNGLVEGQALTTGCMLDKLSTKERDNRRVLIGGAKDLKDAISKSIGMVGEVGLDALCQEFGSKLAKKWNSTPTEVEKAIRLVHASVQALQL
jgi:hypothetical protein